MGTPAPVLVALDLVFGIATPYNPAVLVRGMPQLGAVCTAAVATE